MGRLYRTHGSDDNDNILTEFNYYADNSIKTIDHQGSHGNHITEYQYNALGKVDTIIDPTAVNASDYTTFGYTEAGERNSVNDAESNGTSYTYNGFGQIVSQVSPDTGATIFRYDEAGNLVQKTLNDDSIIRYKYDELNRLIYVAAGDDIYAYYYDQPIDVNTSQLGFLTGSANSQSCSSYQYNIFGELTEQVDNIQAGSFTTQYTYTDLGQVETLTYPSGNSVTYIYDYEGNVSDITTTIAGNTSDVVTDVTHYPFGQMSQLTYGNLLVRDTVHDLDYRIDSIVTAGIQDLDYGYDDKDNINSITNSQNTSMSQSFTYDGLDRIDTLTINSDVYDYDYDNVGNREEVTLNGTVYETYVPSVGNRLDRVIRTTGDRQFTYDTKGNVISDTAFSEPTRTYTYNSLNRMKTHTQSSEVTYYLYNNLGQRMQKNVGGVISRYIYGQGGELLHEFKANTNDTDYIYLNGEPIGLIRNSQLYFVHNDHLGRAEVITDTATTVVWRADNYAFDRSVSSAYSYTYDVGLPGQFWDEEKGNWYNYYRDYDSNSGRYLQSDPLGLGNGANTYTYVSNNPVINIDPLGLFDVYAYKTKTGNYMYDVRFYYPKAGYLERKGVSPVRSVSKFLSIANLAHKATGVSDIEGKDYKETYKLQTQCDEMDSKAKNFLSYTTANLTEKRLRRFMNEFLTQYPEMKQFYDVDLIIGRAQVRAIGWEN